MEVKYRFLYLQQFKMYIMQIRYFLFFIFLFSLSNFSFAQKKPAYQLYTYKGKKTKYKRMLKDAPKAEVVLFGEFHNNPISHWLQLELILDLHKKEIPFNLGAEMFEADNQQALTAYLSGEISTEEFKEKARLWPNYTTDYAPLVNFAKEHNIAFNATNIPRRYASKVYKEGGFDALNTLSLEEKNWMAPLPIPFDAELKTYRDMIEMMGSHATEDIVKAQAIKDASMAHFILKNKEEGRLFVHFNGSYHSNFYEGIVWYLKTYQENINVLTITTVEQDDISELEEIHKNTADYIICVPSTMTKTY